MPYSTDILRHRVTFYDPVPIEDDYGRNIVWKKVATYWCDFTGTKGVAALAEGAVAAYEQRLVRTRYHADLNGDMRCSCGGKFYQIKKETFLDDPLLNTIQFTCQSIEAFDYE